MTVAADVTCGTDNHSQGKIHAIPTMARAIRWLRCRRTGHGQQLRAAGAETRAAVGVLTRSIRIVSAGDTLTSVSRRPRGITDARATTSAAT